MDKKTGILALGTLIGAGLLSSKKFNKVMDAETFMAQGKRVNAIRANRINDGEVIEKYKTEWYREVRDKIESVEKKEGLLDIYNRLRYNQKDYETYMNLTGNQNPFTDHTYLRMLVSIFHFWQNEMREKFKSEYQNLENIYANQLSKTQTAIERVMQDFEPIAKNGNYLSQMTIKDFLDSYPAVATTLENFKQTMGSQASRIKNNTGSGFTLPKIGQYQFINSDLDWRNMDLVNFVKVIGLSNRYGGNYMDDNLVSRIETRITNLRQLNDYYNRAEPMTTNVVGVGEYHTNYTKQEVEFIQERINQTFNVIGYANILGWVQFFKANPSIKTVGLGGQGRNYGEKMYAVELTDEYPSNVPKGIESYAPVWDNSIWSSVFTEKQFNLLKQDGMDKLNNILKSHVAEMKRVAKKRERLQDSVQEESNKAYLSAIKNVFSDYPNFGGTNQQYQLMQIYYDAIGVRFGNRWYSFPVEVDEFSTLQYGYQGQEPQIIKATTVNLQNNDLRRRCEEDKDLQEKVIKLIPQKVKTDAKAFYVDTMDNMVKGAKVDVETAELKLTNLEDKYVQQLKLF